MTRSLLACATLLSAVLGSAHATLEMPSRELPMAEAPVVAFRAPHVGAHPSIVVTAPLEKAAAAEEHPGGRMRVGTVRGLPKAAPVERWMPVPGGYVARLHAASAGAEGLRVRLDVGALSSALEVRVQGSGRVELLILEPGPAREAWTPWTEGEAQAIEIFGRSVPPVEVASVAHFTASPFAKAAGSCTVPTMCTAGSATLDAAIAQAKRSIMRLNFIENGGAFICTATLINTERAGAHVLTANHCISNAAAANSIASLWFHELSGCDAASPVSPGQVQVPGGMQLVFTNANVDSTLLLMPGSPPAGAVFAAWNASRLTSGASVVSLSHPTGDTARLALGATSREYRIIGRPQDMYGVRFTRGIIQGGSSGSGLFTLSGGSLQLRGVLSGTTIRQAGGMSCTNLEEDALYGRLDIFQPQIDQFIRNTSVAADDAPNRIQDVPADTVGASAALNLRATPLAFDGRRIDYAGDLDVYRFLLTAPATVTAWTEGANLDTVGSILDSRGVNLQANDDAQVRDNHFGVTWRLEPGTYYVQVGHFEPRGTGAYNLRIRADDVEAMNHTALWWNPAEPGWGLNVNHQGNTVFATLFTYDAVGPMWLVMSAGERQADGTYQGTLYRTTGSAFNANPFTGATATSVGTMRLAFLGDHIANIAYTFDGVPVSKSLTRQAFGELPSCTWSAFDRSFENNYQDLWFNPNEPGWGVNITHQGDKVFATLFTYDATGRGLWLVMSDGVLASGGFSGPLYRTTGPVFNASPWVAAIPTQVGTMTFAPSGSDGSGATLTYTFENVTVTKQVQRQVFSTLKPLCE